MKNPVVYYSCQVMSAIIVRDVIVRVAYVRGAEIAYAPIISRMLVLDSGTIIYVGACLTVQLCVFTTLMEDTCSPKLFLAALLVIGLSLPMLAQGK